MQTFAEPHTLFWRTGDQKRSALRGCRLMTTPSLVFKALNHMLDAANAMEANNLCCISYFIQAERKRVVSSSQGFVRSSEIAVVTA